MERGRRLGDSGTKQSSSGRPGGCEERDGEGKEIGRLRDKAVLIRKTRCVCDERDGEGEEIGRLRDKAVIIRKTRWV